MRMNRSYGYQQKKLAVGTASRGDRYLGHSGRHTQVPIPLTIIFHLILLGKHETPNNTTHYKRRHKPPGCYAYRKDDKAYCENDQCPLKHKPIILII